MDGSVVNPMSKWRVRRCVRQASSAKPLALPEIRLLLSEELAGPSAPHDSELFEIGESG